MIDFQKLLETLSGSGVKFVIVGGVAATIHGSARLTSDIDVVYDRSDDNLRLSPLQPYLRGAPAGLPFRFDEKTLRSGPELHLHHIRRPARPPRTSRRRRCGLRAAHNRRRRSCRRGTTYRCIDLETLIKAKRAAGRPKDLEVIAELETIRDSRD